MRTLNHLLTLLLISFLVTSCWKRNEDKDTQAANDNAQSEFVSDDIENLAESAIQPSGSMKTGAPAGELNQFGTCATITRDTVNSADADTVTIDFGTSNVTCLDNRQRRGVITIVYFGDKWTAGSFRTVTFTNFYVNDYGVEGKHTITANGKNSSGNYNWSILAENMKITRPTDEKYHTWNSSRNREMVEGLTTSLDRQDDAFLITGSASGTNIDGINYEATITNALRREISCTWFVSGTVVITPEKKKSRTLDFGDGACDDEATVSIRKQTYTIKLK